MSDTTLALTLDSEHQPVLNFLFIDDNKLMRRNLENSFKVANSKGVQAHFCANLETAEKRLKQERADLVVVDFKLSHSEQELTGADWIDIIADKYPNSLFIIYTTYGGNPRLAKKIDPLYQRHNNFELFIEEKGSHEKLIQVCQGFVDQFLGVPSAFYRLLERLEQKIESSKNHQCFLEGEAYYQFQQDLNELRDKIAEQLENFDNELLRRQYEKLKRNWYDLLKEYHPQSPDVVSLWTRVKYFQFFNRSEFKPYLSKMGISSFRIFDSVLNLYKITEDTPEEKQKKLNEQRELEWGFFVHLLKTLPEGEVFQYKRLTSYLKLRKSDLEQKILPAILYELADKKEHLLPRVLQNWDQYQSVQELQKLLHPAQKRLSEKPENLTNVLDQVKKKIDLQLEPKWQKIPSGYYVLGKENVATILPSTCSVIFGDVSLPKLFLRIFWDKYSNPCLDTIPSSLPLPNFTSLLETLILARKDMDKNFTQKPVLVVGYSDFLEKVEKIMNFWVSGEYFDDYACPYCESLLQNNNFYLWEIPQS